jgi:hypothetical protein
MSVSAEVVSLPFPMAALPERVRRDDLTAWDLSSVEPRGLEILETLNSLFDTLDAAFAGDCEL